MTGPAASGVPAPATHLTTDEQLLQQSVDAFARDVLARDAAARDANGSMPGPLIEELFALGLMGVEVPEALGGPGGSFMHVVLTVEALSRVDPSVALLVDVQNTLVVKALLQWGTEAQRVRWLPPLTSRDVGAYALTEAASGSDAFALETRAERAAGGYRLSGRKQWITNAAEARVFLIFATVDRTAGYKGITAFVVPRESAGLRVGRKEDKLGIRASSTCELVLDDCFVADDQVLGDVGAGYRVAIETLNQGRIGIGAQMVGIADAALAHAVAHARDRRQFGHALADFQGVQFQIARMATDVATARLLVYHAARVCASGLAVQTEAAMAKLVASETAERVTSQAINLLGGLGFMKESPVGRLYRDAKIGQIYEGTSNMQLLTIAKALV